MITMTATSRCSVLVLMVVSLSASLIHGQQVTSGESWLQYGHGCNWRSELSLEQQSAMEVAWDVKVGEGRSQAVLIDDVIYVSSGSSERLGDRNQLTTRVVALDATSGEEQWKHERTSTMFAEQETFSGATPSPQSTPAIVGPYLITMDFAGQLTCLNRTDGKPVWNINLVKDFGAEPVQFGFSASPVINSSNLEQICVLAAGKSAGFFCLDVRDGSVIWKADCTTCSYATPVDADFGGVAQWIIVSENEVLGISKSNGKRLWRFELPETGLTNVPTPLVFDKSRLIISGQGCKGTRCLSIGREENEWDVEEQWFAPKFQMFYTNWARVNERIIAGCTDKYLAALDVSDGTLLGRWRGFGDGNLAITDGHLLVMDGKGTLNVLEITDPSKNRVAGFTATRKLDILDARCWTPPSIIKNRILIRGDDRLICLNVNQENNSNSLTNQLSSDGILEFQSEMAKPEGTDPLEQIFATFEAKGQEQAMVLYSKFRAASSLDEACRIAMAEAAKEQGLVDVAKIVMSHAVEDFPDSKVIASAAKSILGK